LFPIQPKVQNMDRKLNKVIADYVGDFKKDIKQKAIDLKFEEIEKIEGLVEFIFNYDRLILTKEDVSKRKRIKNSIPCTNRCNAKRANGEQCTRKQKENCIFCGTHVKGTPHGVVNSLQDDAANNIIVSEVFAQEIGGIVYYLDKHNNVFHTEDVLKGTENPKVIASYTNKNGVYHIPSLGI
jgi:hypothetical protein